MRALCPGVFPATGQKTRVRGIRHYRFRSCQGVDGSYQSVVGSCQGVDRSCEGVEGPDRVWMIRANGSGSAKNRGVNQRARLPSHLPAQFRVSDARASGVAEKRLDATDLVAPFHGMHTTSRAHTDGTRYERLASELDFAARSYLVVAPSGFAYSHVTAARLYGMPLPERLLARDGLDVATAGRAVRRAGIRGHSVSSIDVLIVDGLPVMGPESTWIQLATLLTLDDLIVAGDHLVRRKRPQSSLEKLTAAVHGWAGNRGARRAVAALSRVRSRTDSPPESRVRLLIVNAGLPEPLVGYEVHDDDGYWVGTPDLAYPLHKVAIEYQGEGHRDEKTFEDDIARLERFHDAGWTVIQITKGQLRDPRGITERVRLALAEGSTRR